MQTKNPSEAELSQAAYEVGILCDPQMLARLILDFDFQVMESVDKPENCARYGALLVGSVLAFDYMWQIINLEEYAPAHVFRVYLAKVAVRAEQLVQKLVQAHHVDKEVS